MTKHVHRSPSIRPRRKDAQSNRGPQKCALRQCKSSLLRPLSRHPASKGHLRGRHRRAGWSRATRGRWVCWLQLASSPAESHLPAADPRAQRPAVHLVRPVVDPERPRVAEDALDHVSRVMPMPPRICSERSATRAIASEQITLLIELSFEAEDSPTLPASCSTPSMSTTSSHSRTITFTCA